MTDLAQRFLNAYLSFASPPKTVFTNDFPKEMQASEVDEDGWVEWKPTTGALQEDDYHRLEKQFSVVFPKSFIDWHRAYHFLDGDCSIIRLPESNPKQPLEGLRQTLDWFLPEQHLVPQKLYPFADEGNNAGPLVFDGRQPMPNNEFSIRVYDHELGGELSGLSEVIFSSFPKLMECLTHYLTEAQRKKEFEIVPDFFRIDPDGAGKSGLSYWLGWTDMLKGNLG